MLEQLGTIDIPHNNEFKTVQLGSQTVKKINCHLFLLSHDSPLPEWDPCRKTRILVFCLSQLQFYDPVCSMKVCFNHSCKWQGSLGFLIVIKFLSLLLLLLNHFSRVRLCAAPQTAAHQAPPSLGLSRQEHWSGLPFPSPMHESEKWKWSGSVVSDS